MAADRTIDLQSKGATIAEVLECMSDRVGFKVVIEPGVVLNQPLNLSLTRQTEPQLVWAVLDGLRLNYAHSADRTGTRVLTLFILGHERTTSKSATGPAGRSEQQPASGFTEPEPQQYEGEPPTDRSLGSARGTMPVYPSSPLLIPPPHSPGSPFYPEPRPLSPMTLRDSRRIPSSTALASSPIRPPSVQRPVRLGSP